MTTNTYVSQKKKIDEAVATVREVTSKAAKTRESALKFLADIGVTFPEKSIVKKSTRKK
jgi:hypothetical protein